MNTPVEKTADATKAEFTEPLRSFTAADLADVYFESRGEAYAQLAALHPDRYRFLSGECEKF